MKIKFIHTADLHLGRPFTNASFPKEISKERRQEQWDTFEKIITVAKDNDVNFLFISGDLFEKDYITMGEIKRAHQYFQRIPMIQIIIIAGNHDPYGKQSFYYNYPWDEHIHVVKEEGLALMEFPLLDTAIYGYSWKEQYITEDIFKERIVQTTCKNKVLLVHGDIYHKESKYLPIDALKLANMPFDYVALGHIHKQDVIQQHIRYCGSPEPLDFGEGGEHGIILGEIDDNVLNVEFIPLAQRQFIVQTLELNPEMNYTQISDYIQNLRNDEKDLYRIILKGIVDSDIPLKELLNQIEEKFYHIEWVDRTVPDYNLEKIILENESNIIGAFIREMNNYDLENEVAKDALYIGLEALLKERNM